MTLTIDKANGEPLTPNGGAELPASRQAAVQQGLHFYQETAAERDRLQDENASLKTTIAGHKVAIDVLEAQLGEARSEIQTATLMRDQAVADRAKWETLFLSIAATLNAFKPPTTPLVKTTAPAPEAAAGGS